jgi:hypothetical protein
MEMENTVVVSAILTQVQIVRPNVVLCGGPAALTVDEALRSRPVRSSNGLDGT